MSKQDEPRDAVVLEGNTDKMPTAKSLRESKAATPMQRGLLIWKLRNYATEYDSVTFGSFTHKTYLEPALVEELRKAGYCVAIEADRTKWMVSWSEGAKQ